MYIIDIGIDQYDKPKMIGTFHTYEEAYRWLIEHHFPQDADIVEIMTRREALARRRQEEKEALD